MGKKEEDTSQTIKISNGRRLVLCLYSENVVFTTCVRPLRDKKVRLLTELNDRRRKSIALGGKFTYAK